MGAKEAGKNFLTYIPKRIKKEFHKNRSSTPFLISVSFLISFLTARTWVIVFEAEKTDPAPVYLGRNLVLGGYHIHHITYGIILILIAAWLAIHYWSRTIVRISSILYGAGLGLIVDELGFIIGGIEPYQADREVFYIAVFIIGVMLSIVYFPSFYSTIKRDIKRWKRILFK